MPKVLRIIHRLSISGPTYNAAYLTKYLPPPFESQLIAGALEADEASGDFILNGFGVTPVYVPDMHRALHPVNDFKAFRQIRKIIKSYKPDIVHTHASKAGALGRMAAIAEDVPVIVHTFHGHVFHSYYNKFLTRFFINVERGLARKTDKIVAISNLQKADLAAQFKICSADKIAVIPLGFNLAAFAENQSEKRKIFRTEFQLEKDVVAIGIVGRLTKIKNHDLFLKAFAAIKNNASQKNKAFIVGDGERKNDLLLLCEKLGLTTTETNKNYKNSDIVFTSWRQDMPIVYAGLDVVALSSLNEGTPVALIEAQAAQKPIVSTNVGGVKDVVIENKNALLSSSDNTEEYTKQLRLLIENKELRQKFAQEKNNVISKFGYERLVQDTAELYESLLELHV